MNALIKIDTWALPDAPAGFTPVAELGDDGIALSWSRCPDDFDGMSGDNWTAEPAIPWPFVEPGDQFGGEGNEARIPFSVIRPILSNLGFTIVEY